MMRKSTILLLWLLQFFGGDGDGIFWATKTTTTMSFYVCSFVFPSTTPIMMMKKNKKKEKKTNGQMIATTTTTTTKRTTMMMTASTKKTSDENVLFTNADDNEYDDTNNQKEIQISNKLNVPTTMKEAIQTFFFSGTYYGPILVVLSIGTLIWWRLQLLYTCIPTTPTTYLLQDIIPFSITILFWPFQEYFLHKAVLHSQKDWIGKAIHEEHHNNDYYHVSIDSSILLLSWMVLAFGIIYSLCNTFLNFLPTLQNIQILPMTISATIGYSIAGLFYEWTHYIVHTKVQFTKRNNPFWNRVKENHIRHHLVNSNYWYSFSIPYIDDIFHTNPSIQQAVQEKKSDE